MLKKSETNVSIFLTNSLFCGWLLIYNNCQSVASMQTCDPRSCNFVPKDQIEPMKMKKKFQKTD